MIHAKVSPFQQLENAILQKIDKLIDELSDFREKIKTQMQKDLKTNGLQQNDQIFLNALNRLNEQVLTGKKVHQMFTSSTTQDKKTEKDSLEENFNNIWNYLKKEVEKRTTEIFKMLECLKLGKFFFFTDILQDSKVVVSEEHKQRLMEMFRQKIPTSSRLLYRASENEFSAQNFHQKCDNVPHTLTLCETIHGQLIGGYTPQVWDKNASIQNIKDESGSSFIFSLSNNHKFKLDKTKTAIYQSRTQGPVFGNGNPDFYITNSANTINSSTQINQSYFNQNYTQGSVESWQKFNGNPDKTSCYKSKEWEVWQLRFQS